MYKIPAKTLFIGKNLIYVPECHSTNDLIAQIAGQRSSFDGTVVITDKQTKGRGQRGNQWISEAGLNLTFSILLRPSFLVPGDQFFLTRITSLAIYDLLTSLFDLNVSIKWPNDIMVFDKKICGILIENQLRGNEITHTIIGIGLNVNQEIFQFSSATSLKQVTKKNFSLPSLLEELLEKIEARYLELRNGRQKELQFAYHEAMYWRDEMHTFSAYGNELVGIINGVDSTGKLLVDIDGKTHSFGLKEIEYVI